MIALIGLAIGFIVSFFLTSSYNKGHAGPAASVTPAGPGNAAGAGGQQAMMGQVQAVIEKAKNNPRDPQAQVEAAKVFYQIGRTKEAIDYLNRASEVDPDNVNIAVNLGVLNSEAKNYVEAEKSLKRAVELEPKEADLFVELAATFIQREPPQPDKAIQEIQRALAIDPKNGHALGHLIEAYALKKDARGAEESLNRLKEADPSNQRIFSLQAI